jgi:hypothetical protein
MVRRRAASSAEREQGPKRSNFQIRMKYSGWSQHGMRRECTRMYGAASVRMAIFKYGSTDRLVVVHSDRVFVSRVGGR